MFQRLSTQPLDIKKWSKLLIIFLFFFGVTFTSSDLFIDGETLSKWYAFSGIALLSVFLHLFLYEECAFQIDLLAISTICIVSYMIFRICSTTFGTIEVTELSCFILLFFLFKSLSLTLVNYTQLIIVFVCLAQGIYGLVRLDSSFYLSGSYDNPAGLAACLSAGLPFFLVRNPPYKTLRTVCNIVVLIIGVCILLSGSRTGVLAAGTIALIYCIKKYKLQTVLRKRNVFVAFTFFLLSTIVLLFMYKKESAFGRVLIWKNSIALVEKAPLWGSGSGAFYANYMQEQARYFEKHPNSQYSMLSDNVHRPFNEYIAVLIGYGLFGFLLLIWMGTIILRSKIELNEYMLSLFGIAIFSLFSYPFRYPFICSITAFCLSQFSNGNKSLFELKINVKTRAVLVIGVTVGVYFLFKDIGFEYRWKQLMKYSSLGKTKDIICDYASLNDRWNGNPLFLYNYGAELNRLGEYHKSVEALLRCEKYFSDYDVQLLLADNYTNLKAWEIAEGRYLLAHKMIPNRFVPLRELFFLYESMDDHKKRDSLGNIILNKRVKIPSNTIHNIKNDVYEKMK